jgi:hypothetical protein
VVCARTALLTAALLHAALLRVPRLPVPFAEQLIVQNGPRRFVASQALAAEGEGGRRSKVKVGRQIPRPHYPGPPNPQSESGPLPHK